MGQIGDCCRKSQRGAAGHFRRMQAVRQLRCPLPWAVLGGGGLRCAPCPPCSHVCPSLRSAVPGVTVCAAPSDGLQPHAASIPHCCHLCPHATSRCPAWRHPTLPVLSPRSPVSSTATLWGGGGLSLTLTVTPCLRCSLSQIPSPSQDQSQGRGSRPPPTSPPLEEGLGTVGVRYGPGVPNTRGGRLSAPPLPHPTLLCRRDTRMGTVPPPGAAGPGLGAFAPVGNTSCATCGVTAAHR